MKSEFTWLSMATTPCLALLRRFYLPEDILQLPEHKHGLSSKNYSKDEIPDALKNTEADEVSTKGQLVCKRLKNTAASAVDTVVTPVGKTVGGGINAVSAAVKPKDTKDE